MSSIADRSWVLAAFSAGMALLQFASLGAGLPQGAVERTGERSFSQKAFDLPDGKRAYEISSGHLHYKDANGHFQEIDPRFSFSQARQAWVVNKASYNASVPLYADGPMDFKDVYQGRNQSVRTIARARHVQGALVSTTRTQYINFENAWGEGIDLRVYPSWIGIRKVIVVNAVPTTTALALNFDFIVQTSEPIADGDTSQTWTQSSDLDFTTRQARIGDILIKPALWWDSGGHRSTVPIRFAERNGKTLLRKTVPLGLLNKATLPFFTDDDFNFDAGSGTGSVTKSGGDWSTIRSASSGDYASGDWGVFTDQTNEDIDWPPAQYDIRRAFFVFDTSGLDDSVTVNSASVELSGVVDFYNDDGEAAFELVNSTQSSPTSLSASDYSNLGTTVYDSHDFSTGLGSFDVPASIVQVAGYTKFGMRENHDLSDIEIPYDGSYSYYGTTNGVMDPPVLYVTATVPNQAPTDIGLSSSAIDENLAANSTVGSFSTTDPNQVDTFSYSLVSGTGSTDNATFHITGANLIANPSFDYETKNSYSIRVRSTDQGSLYYEKQFTVTVNNVNEAPVLSGLATSASFNENTVNAGYQIIDSSVSLSDPDSPSSFNGGNLTVSYISGGSSQDYLTIKDEGAGAGHITVASGTVSYGGTAIGTISSNGDAGTSLVVGLNSSATVAATQHLIERVGYKNTSNAPSSSRTVHFSVTDSSGGLSTQPSTTNNVAIGVTAENDPPTDIALSASTVAENAANDTIIGDLSGTDPDGGNTFTYSLVSPYSSAGGRFKISGTHLEVASGSLLDFESATSHQITVRTTDQGGLTHDKNFTVTVTNVNETPTDVALTTATLAENSANDTIVGNLSSTDPDAGNTFTYSLVSPYSNAGGRFKISGVHLEVANGSLLDYESATSHTVTVRTTDQGGLSHDKNFAIALTNVYDTAPTDISVTGSSIAENSAEGTVVGTLSSADVEAGDAFTYSFVAPESDAGGRLKIVGNQLEAGATNIDYESTTSLQVRIRSTDLGSRTFDKVLTIAVTNVNETPTEIGLTTTTLAENTPNDTIIGDLSSSDPDSGNTFAYSLVSPYTDAGGRFKISGVHLEVANGSLLDYESATSHQITVRTTDQGGLSHDKNFTITLTNVNEAPVFGTDPIEKTAAYQGDGSYSDSLAGWATDVDGDALTYSKAAGPAWLNVASDGTLSLASGESIDAADIGLKDFTVDVSDGHGGSDEATLQIKVRPLVQFAAGASNGDEGDDAHLMIGIPQAAAEETQVHYSVSGGTATFGDDYTPSSGDATIAAGQTTATIDLAIADDGLDEAPETIVVHLSAPTNAKLGANVDHTYTIDDNDPIAVGAADLTIDGLGMVRMHPTIENAGSPGSDYTFHWSQQGASGLLTDADTSRSLFADYSGATTQTQISVWVQNSGDGADAGTTQTLTVSTAAWDGLELGPLMNLTGDAQSASILLGERWAAHAILRGAEGYEVLWTGLSSSAQTLVTRYYADHWRTTVASDMQLLGAGQSGDDQILVYRKPSTGEVRARLRPAADLATKTWDDGSLADLQVLSDADPTTAETTIARIGSAWYVQTFDGASTAKILKIEGGTASLLQTVSGAKSATAAAGADGRLYVAYLDGATSGHLKTYAPATDAWTSGDYSLGGDYDRVKAVADSKGNLWLLHDQFAPDKQVKVHLLKFDSGTSVYAGTLIDASATLPTAHDVSELLPGQWADADDRGYVYLAATTSPTLALSRMELDASDAVVVTTSSLGLSKRAIPGANDAHPAVFFGGRSDGLVAWAPALNNADSLYLAAREFKCGILLDDGYPNTIHAWVKADLELSDPTDVQVRLFGPDVTGATVDGAAVAPGAWFDYPTSKTLMVQLNSSHRGLSGDAGRQTIWAQFRRGGAEGTYSWPVRDDIVYLADAEVAVTGIEIGDPTGDDVTPITAPVEMNSGVVYPFRIKFTYAPAGLSLRLDGTDVNWSLTNGIGSIAPNGDFTAGPLSVGDLTAVEPASGATDTVRIYVHAPGSVAYFDIVPDKTITLGPGEQTRLRAVGRDAAGNAIDGDPVWSNFGPGSIMQTGLYTAPGSGPADRTEVRVFDRNNPSAAGTKTLALDTQPPQVVGLDIEDLSSTGTAHGIVDVVWRLAESPVEASPPVAYTLLLDGRAELDRLTSDTVHAAEFRLTGWDTRKWPDGAHTLQVVATDAKGNTNRANPPTLAFNIGNGQGAAPTQPGLDWLLTHQWRYPDADFGSWRSPTLVPYAERVAEAAAAVKTLSTSDMRYVSQSTCDQSSSAEHVSVAQAYRDGVVWLGEQLASGAIDDFALGCMAVDAIAPGAALKGRLQTLLGGVDPKYDAALSAASSRFETIDLALKQDARGLFAADRESLSTRFETMWALQAALSLGRSDLLADFMPPWLADLDKNAAWTGETAWTQADNTGGWADLARAEFLLYRNGAQRMNEDGFFLTARIYSLMNDLSGQTGEPLLKKPLGDTANLYGFLSGFVNPELGGYPADTPNAVDAAAGLQAFVMGRIYRGAQTDLAPVQSGAQFLLARQTVDGSAGGESDGSWNRRAYDTAWAVRALRPELILTIPDDAFSVADQSLTVKVENRGAVDAGDFTVGIFEKDPRLLSPEDRSGARLAQTTVNGLALGQTASVEIPLPVRTARQLYVMVDPEETVAEYYKTNNTALWELPAKPNLYVYSEGIKVSALNGGTPVDGVEWSLDVEVWNLGQQTIPAGMIHLALYDNDPMTASQPRLLATISNQGEELGGGSERTMRFTIGPSIAALQTPGVHGLYVWADPDSGLNGGTGLIDEAIETDNIASRSVTIHPRAILGDKPDLAIDPQSIVYGPQPFYQDQTGWIDVRVDNIGGGASPDFKLGLFYDDFETSTTVNVAGLGRLQSRTVRLPLALAAATSVSLRLTADPGGLIDDADRSNNSAKTIVVVHVRLSTPVLDLATDRAHLKVARGTNGEVYLDGTIFNLRDAVVSNETTSYSLPIAQRYVYQDGIATTATTATAFSLAANGLYPVAGQEDMSQGAGASKIATFALDFTQGLQLGGENVEYSAANNVTTRTINLTPTNLRIVDLTVAPREATVDDATSAGARVAISVVLANGDGSGAYEDAENVHLKIYDSLSGRELAYWNGLSVPAMALENGETRNVLTLSLPQATLPPGLYNITAFIDPENTYIEDDETDNIKSVPVKIADGASRPAPDLTISGARFRTTDAGLFLEAVVENKASGSSLPLAAENVTVQAFDETLAGAALTSPTIVARLEPGVPQPVAMRVNRSAEEFDAVTTAALAIDPADAVAESNETNNVVLLSTPQLGAVQSLTAMALFRSALLEWTPPAATDPPVNVAEYRLARYRMTGGAPVFEKMWHLTPATLSYEDADKALLQSTLYRYAILPVGGNGRLGVSRSIDEQTGTVPLITEVAGQAISNADPTSTTTILLSDGTGIAIQAAFDHDADLDLIVNGAIVGAPVQPTDGIATFSGINLTQPRNRIVVAARAGSAGHQFTGYSNTVEARLDNFPDLAFAKDAAGKPLVHIQWSNGASGDHWNELTDPGKVDQLAGRYVRLTADIVNSGNGAAGSFNLAVLLNAAASPVRAIPVAALSAGESATAATTFKMPFGAISRMRIFIDYALAADGANRGGNIIESNESNNTFDLLADEEGTEAGTEFVLPVPLACIAPYKYTPNLDGSDKLNFTAISTDDSSSQVVHMDICVPDAAGTPGSNHFVPWDDALTGHRPAFNLSSNYYADWALPIRYVPRSFPGYSMSIEWSQPPNLFEPARYAPEYNAGDLGGRIFSGLMMRARSETPFKLTCDFIMPNANSRFLAIPKAQLSKNYYINYYQSATEPRTMIEISAVEGPTTLTLHQKISEPDQTSYDQTTAVSLNYGETYIWQQPRNDGYGLPSKDPSGMYIEASKKIAVVCGGGWIAPLDSICTDYDMLMAPPVEMAGTEFVVPPIPLARPTHGVGEGNQNIRIVGVSRAANGDPAIVNVQMQGSTSYTQNLAPGHVMDVGIDMQSPPGRTTYEQSASYWHYIKATAPVQAMLIEAGSAKVVGTRVSRYLPKRDGFDNTYLDTGPGDPESIWVLPTTMFTTQSRIPFKTRYLDDYVAITARVAEDATPYVLCDMADVVASQFVGMDGTSPWRSIIDQSTGEYSGYKTTTIHLDQTPTIYTFVDYLDIDKDYFYWIDNPDRLPLEVRVTGVQPWNTYGTTEGYDFRTPADPNPHQYDVAVEPWAISFPASGNRFAAGEAVTARVEVLNRGKSAIAAEGASIRAMILRRGQADLPENYEPYPIPGEEDGWLKIPASGSIAPLGAEPYDVQFEFTPDTTIDRLRVEVSQTEDEDTTNNIADFRFNDSDFDKPNLKVESIVFDPASGPLPYGDNAVDVAVTVSCSDVPVNEANLSLDIAAIDGGAGFATGDPAEPLHVDLPVLFDPTTIATAEAGYVARTTLHYAWRPAVEGYYSATASIAATGKESGVEESDATDNAASAEYDFSTVRGNLRAVSLHASPGTLAAGGTTELTLTAKNNNVVDYANVPVTFYLGDPAGGSAVELATQTIASFAKSQTATVTQQVRLDEAGPHSIYAYLDPAGTLFESARYDNSICTPVTVIASAGSDLSLAAPGDFMPPAQIVQGAAVPLEAWAANIGLANVAVPYKLEILDGAAKRAQGTLLADAIVNLPAGSAQAYGAKRPIDGSWATGDAATGLHTLFLTIDSPDHLAAAAGDGSAASTTPLTGYRLANAAGIDLAGAPGIADGRQWSLEVFATDAATTSAETLVGRWTAGEGFSNWTLDENSARQYWQADHNAPILLVFKSLDGEPFPTMAAPMSATLRFWIGSGPGGDQIATRTILLPPNDRGQWGDRLALWAADDGSTYFGLRYHLAGDYAAAGANGEGVLANLTAGESMGDATGAEAEASESNNVFARSVTIVPPAFPDLKGAGLAPEANSIANGRTIGLDATFVNAGRSIPDAATVRFEYRLQGEPSGAAGLIGETKILGGLEHGQPASVRMDWTPTTATGSLILSATIDPDDAIEELDENNNTTTATLFIDETTTLTLEPASPGMYAADAIIQTTATVLSSETSSATLAIEIRRAAGGGAARAFDLATSVPFAIHGTHSFSAATSASALLAGDYYLQASLWRIADGRLEQPPIETRSDVFSIAADKGLAAALTSPRTLYNPGEPLRFDAVIDNASANYIFPEVKAILSIADGRAVELWRSDTRLLAQLDLGQSKPLSFQWDDPLWTGQSMTATVTAFEDINGNGAPDAGEPSAASSLQIGTESRSVLLGRVDLRDAMLGDLLYTSQSQAQAVLSALGESDLTSGGLMALGEAPLAGDVFLSRNLIRDSDFETTFALTGAWSETADDGLTTFETTASMAARGSRSLHLAGASGGAVATAAGDAATTYATGIAVAPSTIYTLSFYHREATTATGLLASVVERDASGAVLREIADPSRHQSDGAWTREEFTFQTGAGAASVGVRLALDGTGTLESWIDAAQLEIGTAAGAWQPGPHDPGAPAPSNLLVNPSLTLDSGTTWTLFNPLLDAAMNATAGDGLPDGWMLTGDASTTITTATLPAALELRSLHQDLELAGTTFTLRQSALPAPAAGAAVLSVYASGPGGLSAEIRQYDANGSELSVERTTQTWTLSGAVARYDTATTIAPEAVSLAVRFSASTAGTYRLAAAQLAPGDSARAWTGWVPFAATIDAWPLDAGGDGEKPLEAQLFDRAGRRSLRPTQRLTLDAGGRGTLLDGLANGAYSARTESASGAKSLAAAALFDGDAGTRPVAGSVDRLTVDWSLPSRPAGSDLILYFDQAPASSGSVVLRGGFVAGQWLTTATASLAALNPIDRTLRFEGLDWQYSEYEVEIDLDSPAEPRLAEIDLRGTAWPLRDNIVYDTTPPTGQIEAPATNGLVGIDPFMLSASGYDALSGLRNARYRLEQPGDPGQWLAMQWSATDGAWTAAVSSEGLSDGATTATVLQWDRAGNVSTSIARTIEVDRTPPVLSGASIENTTTSNNAWARTGDALELSITASDAHLTTEGVRADLSALGGAEDAAADQISGDVYTWHLGALGSGATEGLAAATFTATDAAGNASEPATAQITVDRTSPTLTLEAPASATLTTSATTFVGTAVDSGSGRIAAVQYELQSPEWSPGEYLSGEATAADGTFDEASESFSIALTDLGDRDYALLAWALDAAGNRSGTPAQIAFSVDAEAAPMSASLFNLRLQNGDWVRDGDSLILQASFAAGSIPWGSLTADLSALGGDAEAVPNQVSAGQALWFLSRVVCTPGNGVAAIPVYGQDLSGRDTSAEAMIVADNHVPAAAITGASVALVGSDPAYATTGTLTLFGVATDAAPGIVQRVDMRLDGAAWTTTSLTTDLGTTAGFSIDLAGLAEGAHTIELNATDLAGNRSTDHFSSFTLAIDATSPALTNLTLRNLTTLNDAFVRDGDQLELTAYVDDSTFGPDDAIVANLSEFGLGSSAAPTTRTANLAIWAIGSASPSPADGELATTVTAVDPAEHLSELVATIIADDTAPSSTITLVGANPTTSTKIVAIGAATDAVPGRIGAVQVRIDGGAWLAARPHSIPGSPGLFDTASEIYDFATTRTAGTYLLESRAIDQAGNVQPAPYDSVSVTVAPAALTDIQETHMANRSLLDMDPPFIKIFRDGQDLELTAMTRSPGSTTATLHADLSAFGFGSDVIPYAADSTGQIFQWNLPAASSGGTTGVVEGAVWTDDFVSSPTAVTFLADNTSPTLALDANPLTTATGVVRLTGSANDVGSWVSSIVWHVENADGSTTPSLAAFDQPGRIPGPRTFGLVADHLTTGANAIVVQAFDAVGNASGITSTTLYMDPGLPIIGSVEIADQDRPTTYGLAFVRNGDQVMVQADLNDSRYEGFMFHADLTGLGGPADALADEYDHIHARWMVEDAQTSPTNGAVSVAVWISDLTTTPTATGTTTADNAAPEVTLTHQSVVHSATVVYSGTATDSGSGVAYVQMRLAGDSEWTTATLTGSGFSASLSGLSEGYATVEARAADHLGSVSAIVSDTFIVDAATPVLTIDSPTLEGGTPPDLYSTLIVSAAVGGAPAGVNYVNFDALPLGSAGGESGGTTVTFTGSGKTVTGALSGQYAKPFISNSNGVPFGDNTVSGTDNTRYMSTGAGSVKIAFSTPQVYFGMLWGSVDAYNTLSFYNGATLVGKLTGNDVTEGPDGDQGASGTFYVNVLAPPFDSVVASSTSPSFEFDNVSYNPTAPGDLSFPWSATPLAITWHASEALATSHALTVWVDPDSPSTTRSLTLNWNDAPTSEGRYVALVYGEDLAGNVADPVSTAWGIDYTPPVVALSAHTPDPTAETDVTYHGTMRDAGSGVDRVEMRIDGGSWSEVGFENFGAGTFLQEFTGLSDGTHLFEARGYDAVGNVSAATSQTLTVDSGLAALPNFSRRDYLLADGRPPEAFGSGPAAMLRDLGNDRLGPPGDGDRWTAAADGMLLASSERSDQGRSGQSALNLNRRNAYPAIEPDASPRRRRRARKARKPQDRPTDLETEA